ncbi:MAG: hypothetical protein KJZ92_17175 [Rhodocyclaceae bacterium]|nr:hypothetical protein [Rhodocyclaceae bacterium]
MHKIKPRWLAVDGAAEIGESLISFVGQKKVTAKKDAAAKGGVEKKDLLPATLLRSDTYFESGDITGEARISKADMCLFFRLGSIPSNRTTVGLNVLGKTYGLGSVNKGEIREIDSAGAGTQPPLNQWFKFRIRIRGSQLEFLIEDIRVLQGTVSISRSQLEILIRGEGTVELRNLFIEALRPQAFVVMQFTEEYTALYKDVIEPVCTDFGFQVIRGDNVYTNGLIIEDITRSIRECSIVIADITPNNANVYYELGFAHGIGKPAILLSDRNRDKLPFDISGFRLLFYDNTIGGKTAVEQALRKHLEAIRGT